MEMSGQHHAPAALLPENNAGTNLTGGWVGHRACLDILKKRISCQHQNSSLRQFSV